jgi:recombination protein RecR
MAQALENLIKLLGKLPGLGPRSARRAALALLQKKETLLLPLAAALGETAEAIQTCAVCGNLDVTDPCGVCANPARGNGMICVVEQVADLWAIERSGAYRGRYHVLGGVLSALDGIGPEDLAIAPLVHRAATEDVTEIILALNATVDGQTTAHYLVERLAGCNVTITRLAHGVPIGGELDYLDSGTLSAALKSRRTMERL